ncbi:MAG: hypothetical protein IJU23_14520 [Proteobacteria bacterium]|nr:hypothetical protein [Pseudomonadota bacterium]
MKKAKRHIKIRTAKRGIKAILEHIHAKKSSVQAEPKPVPKHETHPGKKEGHVEPPDNPDVSAHLTNLSLRHSGSRPEWFDQEPMKLAGRSRQCRKVYWKIVEEQRRPRKQFLVLVADTGMGKTSFLAELHSLIETSSQSFLTLAPGSAKKTPFYALRSILEQRFYVSGDVPFDCVERFVRGAVCTLIDTPDASEVSESVLALWRPEKDEKVDEKPTVPVPPPSAPRVMPVSEFAKPSSVPPLSAHVSGGASGGAEVVKPSFVPPLSAHVSGGARVSGGAEVVKPSFVPPLSAHVSGGSETVKPTPVPPPLATRVTSMEEILKAHEAQKAGAGANVPDTSDLAEEQANPEGITLQADEETFVVPTNRSRAGNKTAERVAALSKELEQPLEKLLKAEVKHNSLVIMIDDVEDYDDESIEMLGRLFNSIPENSPLTFLVATADKSLIPAGLSKCPVEYMELSALSDRDLAQLTHNVLMKLSETRERLIVPKDICNMIAQKSYGSPKRAMELTLKHFSPDCIIHWNEAIEQLCREPLPSCLRQNLVRRYKECPEAERLILQVSSLLNAPFTSSTIECLVASCPEGKVIGTQSCASLIKNLRNSGFFERTDSIFGPHTVCYTFKHECERLLISSSLGEQMRGNVLRAAAQWYSINNTDGSLDETTGDLWRNYRFMHEACRYYERAAYRAMNQSQLLKSWLLFRKLLKSLPEGNISDRIRLSLDGSKVAFMTGQIDEAFRLCHQACHHATMISAYVQAARASLHIARMMIELGTVRHISRYIRRARFFLSHDSDISTEYMLYAVLVRCDIYRSRYGAARKNLAHARSCMEKIKAGEQEKLYVDWLEAEIDMYSGKCKKSLHLLNAIIKRSEQIEDSHLRAMAFRSLGHLEDLGGNLSGALDAWNIGLGIVQEMNDSVLHANILADIADGALQLSALRTARAATEECLCLAQQTHHKSLIAHCLANNAYLQYMSGQPDKALRSVRKAHRAATALKCVSLWSRTLSLLAILYSTQSCRIHALEKSRKIFSSLERVYEYHGMLLSKARHFVLEAGIFVNQKERMMAVNTYRKALSLYNQIGLDKSAEKIQLLIDGLLNE